jgi:hypothetical protein
MNLNKTYFLIMLIVLILAISAVSAYETEDMNITSIDEGSFLEIDDSEEDIENSDIFNEENFLQSDSSDDDLESNDDVIVVNDWDELQYYCGQSDKDYTLKLKENTNYYPTHFEDANQQIKIKNNVKIIGSKGSWIGDSSSASRRVHYVAMIVEDNEKVGFTFENVTFKWIGSIYSPQSMDGIFIQMGGYKKFTNVFRNCQFSNIIVESGHSSIVYLKKGNALLENCSFINCTTNFGVIGVYDPSSVTSTNMVVRNCYFENNYASTEPGCINNCGKLTVYNTTFIKNRSYWWAGAIHTHSKANTTIYDSRFIDNVAGWNGGALYTYSYLQIYNSVFIGNNCTTNNGGGAIGACAYGSNPHVYIDGCLFEDNANNCWAIGGQSTTGTGRGGAISLMDEGSLEVHRTTFVANAASIGTAICAWAAGDYGSPSVIISDNSFINHTRDGDTLNVQVSGSNAIVSDNYYLGNSIVFSNLTLTKLSESKEKASFEITTTLSHPNWYDEDILNRTLYDVYINDKYAKTVNTTTFSIDFGDLDICNVYVIPTISNRKSNEVTAISTREYIFVSKNNGNDTNSGVSRDKAVSTIQKALQLARYCQNIILLDGDFSENLQIDYDVTIKGEGNATLTNSTSFTVNANNFTLKNLNINGLSNTLIKGNTNVFISNCTLKDNYATLIDSTGFTNIRDSILLNNSKITVNENYNLDYNWWGSTLENQNKPVDLNINNWLVLNATGNINSLEVDHTAEIQFGFYLNGVKYNNLRQINLNLTTVNGTVKNNVTSSESKVTFTLTALGDGILTAGYHNIETTVIFKFIKSHPNVSLSTEDIMFGDNLTVKVTTPGDATGNLTVTVFNQTQTLTITSKNTVFTFSNLKAGNYNVTAVYSGDDKYLNQTTKTNVNVAKYDSNTMINLSSVEVGQDLLITVKLNDDATGNVTLYINSQVETLNLTNSSANYTIKNIKRGDYLIKAVYNGDDKYLTSTDSKFIEVDNVNATMEIAVDNITYGDAAIIKIQLNDDAGGNVSVTIDGITNSSEVNNGIAEVHINNLDAGANKNITVFFTGDDTYFSLTKNATFTISKADLSFNISSSDIMIGQNAIIKITVPKRTTGTFTIGETTANIPLSGEVEFIITDLEIGEYEYTAIYNGNNYNTVSNSTSFKVMEYPTPQVANTETGGKSDYTSNVNGKILFALPVNETVHGITIDSEGNIYITTGQAIYSYTSDGTPRWNFTSSSVMGNFSASVIGRDVIVTPKSGDTLYFINQSSGERYGSSNIYQASSVFSTIIDENATLYVLSELQVDSNSYKLVIVPYKLWENGGDSILVDLGSYAPLTAPTVSDDYIVVLLDGRIRLIDAKTFNIKYSKSGNYQKIRPLLDENGIVYAVLGDSLVAYASSGSQLWKTKITGGVGNQLLLDSETGLYANNANGNLYRYDLATGKESLVSDLKITSGILIDADGNLFFGCDDTFYEITPDGKILWKSQLNNIITGKPVMDENGVIYISTADNTVYAITYTDLKDPNLNMTVENETLTISMDPCCVGDLSFTLNGKNYTVNSISVSNLAGGTYDVNVTYWGDARFEKASKVFNFTLKAKVSDVEPIITGSTFTITLPEDATGNLTVEVNGKTYSQKLVNGKASITLPEGTYEAVITYSGDENYAGFNRTTVLSVKNETQTASNTEVKSTQINPQPVLKQKLASKIVAKKKTFKKSKKVKKYTVTLKSGKTPIKNVKLIIKIKNKTFKATTNSKGKATFKIKKLTKKGKYTATITFKGNKLYKATTKKVKIIVK